MKNKLVAIMLLLCMAFSLVACGKGSDKDVQKDNMQNSQQDETEETGVVYTIKVIDEDNNPIGGMMVQLCTYTRMPELTNAKGIAEFKVQEASDDYKACITSLPDGYVYDGEEYLYFENGATEVVFVIKHEK